MIMKQCFIFSLCCTSILGMKTPRRVSDYTLMTQLKRSIDLRFRNGCLLKFEYTKQILDWLVELIPRLHDTQKIEIRDYVENIHNPDIESFGRRQEVGQF